MFLRELLVDLSTFCPTVAVEHAVADAVAMAVFDADINNKLVWSSAREHCLDLALVIEFEPLIPSLLSRFFENEFIMLSWARMWLLDLSRGLL